MSNKKEQVIKTARTLFTTYGYKKVSMDLIAAESQVTKRTIYTYFKDKEELFEYFILEQRMAIKKLITQIEEKNLPFFDSIHETLYQILHYKKNEKFLTTIGKEADILKTSSVVESLKQMDQEIQEYIKEKLQYAKKNQYIIDCNIDICAFLIYKLYIAVMFDWDSDKLPLNEQEITDNVTKILKTGLFN